MQEAETGRILSPKDLAFADEVIRIKNEEGPWEVIDFIVKYWSSSNPKEYNSFVIDVKNKRDTRANKHGSNKQKTVRATLDIPTKVMQMIRAVYKTDDLQMDEEFFNKFWKRYPIFRVASKL